MTCSRVGTALAAAMIVAAPGVASAQFMPPQQPGSAVQDRWPDPPKPPQAGGAPPPPAAAPAPAPAAAPKRVRAPDPDDPLPTERKPAAPPAPVLAVACNGVFAKDSTHLKLAIKYDSRNITYGQVDGPENSKIPGSILFPNDPKKRLEVIWANDASRAGTQVIAINGKSAWSAPKGLKLGMPLAAIEKLNGRPFKISGFDAEGSAGITSWDGGALASIPGGCKVGARLGLDPKTPKDARDAVSGDKDLVSSDPALRALKPGIVEILIGY